MREARVKHWNFAALALAAAVLAGCAGERAEVVPTNPKTDLSAPAPILTTDRVTDARSAIHLGVARCFPQMQESSFRAELQQDQWFVWADFKDHAFSADVAKSDGRVTNCWDIEV